MDPRSLQAYGIGLALVCLLWVAVRIGLQSNPRAQALLNPGFYALDRIVLAVLVCGYTLLSLNGAIPSVLEELSVFTPDVRIQQAILEWRTQVGGPGGWALLGILAIALTLGLREQWRRSRVLAIMLLSLTAPLLIAARFSVGSFDWDCPALGSCNVVSRLVCSFVAPWPSGSVGRRYRFQS